MRRWMLRLVIRTSGQAIGSGCRSRTGYLQTGLPEMATNIGSRSNTNTGGSAYTPGLVRSGEHSGEESEEVQEGKKQKGRQKSEEGGTETSWCAATAETINAVIHKRKRGP